MSSSFGSSNASMRVASEVSLKMKTGVLYFRGDARGFDRDVETIFHGRGREDDARTVAVSAIDGLVQDRFARHWSADRCSVRRVVH